MPDHHRKRAPRHPPDSDAERTHALEWARVHCRLHRPRIVSYKRLAGGRTACLIRDIQGAGVCVVLNRGEVEDVDAATAFRAMEEVPPRS